MPTQPVSLATNVFVGSTDKSEVRNSWGARPIGFLTYTEDGRMSAILTLDAASEHSK